MENVWSLHELTPRRTPASLQPEVNICGPGTTSTAWELGPDSSNQSPFLIHLHMRNVFLSCFNMADEVVDLEVARQKMRQWREEPIRNSEEVVELDWTPKSEITRDKNAMSKINQVRITD